MLRFILYIYMLILLVDFVVSMFPSLKHQAWAKKISNLTEPTCSIFRKYLPKDLPVDFSHFIVIGAILLLMAIW
jgi:uncharacterized protein YggT (Ycf19 family)